jgi:ornithine--oxo-acid transaminase
MWVGIDLDPELATGRELCEALMAHGVLAKDTHGSTIRLSPPLTTSDDDLNWAMDRLADALGDLRPAAA